MTTQYDELTAAGHDVPPRRGLHTPEAVAALRRRQTATRRSNEDCQERQQARRLVAERTG